MFECVHLNDQNVNARTHRYKTIDSLLDRGCKLDDLVNRSDDLTARSKVFYDTAKSTNSCCIVS